jgi:predicted dehydrogenase
VVISTPDHMHAFPVVAALQAGFAVYCEKPLAHSVWEVRRIREWAAKQKAVTQMGTQIHSGDNYRRVVEIVQAGILGDVKRVHVWLGGGMKIFPKTQYFDKPPEHVNYDLWTGPAPLRQFSEDHFHFNWRYWWDFGNGALGDFGCHYMDLPHWALDLRAPLKVASEGQKGHNGDNECPLDQKVDFHYPARGDKPGVHLTWYQGKYRPEEFAQYGGGKNSAVLLEGDKGRLLADYSTRRMFFDSDTPGEPKPTIPASPGHHTEFLRAVRQKSTTTCNFDYSGALTEAVLLGNVSYRAGNKPLEWDDAGLKVTNCPEAAQYIRREYRKGWELA